MNTSASSSTFLNVWRDIVEWVVNWFTKTILAILAAGPVPQHIGFVMDGNRRYARQRNQKVQEGHYQGFNALHRTLDTCLQLNIRAVSVYAFAIDNFKRPKEEVDALMGLAKDKLMEMSQKGELLDRHGVRLNIVGRRSLLPPDVQEVATKVEEMTKHHANAILNICMPYSSRDELTTAVRDSVRDCKEFGGPEDISEAEIDKRLEIASRGSPPLDVLIRTSGTYRLSDYMLWQACEDVQIHFVQKMWPDFGLWDFVPILLEFQRKALLS